MSTEPSALRKTFFAGRMDPKQVRLAIAVIAGLYVLAVVVMGLLARPEPQLLSDIEVERRGKGPLLVVVHGMPGRDSLDPLLAAIAKEKGPLAEMDLLVPRYASASYVNADPEKLVQRLHSAIKVAALPGQEVILVGHSLGGVLVRDAYLESLRKGGWATRVSRIVMLAALNRGWTNGIGRSWYERSMVWLGEQLYPALFIGKLYDQLRWGSPYISGMRLRWMEQMRTMVESRQTPPEVIQIRGDLDTTVSPRDSADLEDTPRFSAIELPFTDHATVLRMDGDYAGPRRRLILDAIAGKAEHAGQGLRAGPQSCDRTDASVKHVVFAIHGMRTDGVWTDKFVNEFRATRLLDDAFVKPITYEWFSMVPFLFGFERRKRLEAFLDEYVQARACYPQATISVVAHSNGSYIVVRAMERVRELKLARLALAGTVLPQNYDWSKLRVDGKERIGMVFNYTANADWIVGIFPKLYEAWDGDLGGAGFKGFHKTLNGVVNIRGFPGAHSAVVDSPVARKAIAHFLARGERLELASVAPSALVGTLSEWCGAVWGVVALILILVGLGLRWLSRQTGWHRAPTMVSLLYVAVLIGFAFYN